MAVVIRPPLRLLNLKSFVNKTHFDDELFSKRPKVS